MTIKISDVQTRARLLAGDMQKTRYSDYELDAAIEAGVDMLCEALRNFDSPELMRRAVLTLTDGKVALPEGFLSIVGVESSLGDKLDPCYELYDLPDFCYRIEGEYLYSSEGVVSLIYMKNPYDEDEKELDLADSLLSYLASIASHLMKGEIDAASKKAEDAAKMTKEHKRGSIVDPPMWGG